MKFTHAVSLAVLVAFAVPACATSGWNSHDALSADKIEMVMDDLGRQSEIEYHIPPENVPAVVRQAMDQLHPGGPFTGAEKEYNGGMLFYELTRVVDGMEMEVMFYPDGKLHSEELQVPEGSVPAIVRSTAQEALGGGTVTKWEEIRNYRRELYEYHVKITKAGMKYKVMIGLKGELLAIFREIPAEIEVETR